MSDCKAWDAFALEANNLLVSMTDVGELSASTMEIYPRDLLAISWVDSELTRLRAIEKAAKTADKLLPPHSLVFDAEFYCAMEQLRAALKEGG